MHLKLDLSHCLLMLVLSLLLNGTASHAQFWKNVQPLSDRELFELETRSSMASGICYKEVPGRTLDPDQRMRMISFCCEGYARVGDHRSMKCAPICTEDCSNGICTAPDVCECYPGSERRGGRCEDN